jgi:hypothetical protein
VINVRLNFFGQDSPIRHTANGERNNIIDFQTTCGIIDRSPFKISKIDGALVDTLPLCVVCAGMAPKQSPQLGMFD